MKIWLASLLVAALGAGGLLTAQAGPAVLLRTYPVEVIRGNYLLGRRLARTGEAVRLDSVDGPRAKVFTLDGDALTIYAADLKFLPDVAPAAAAKMQPAAPTQPTPAPSPSPTPAPATPLIPDIFGKPSPTPIPKESSAEKTEKPEKGVGPRLEIAVQCSGHTKKGTRCTRMTKSPNGFCWQHGGD